ncbi:MAG TPA: peptidoglycan-associated lipoprotein Pal [candidate division Zixibacteria bacterium]|nr:peptidoglycan-associated lipoprotein Pal [candidate division Zixibacteria bacterium]
MYREQTGVPQVPGRCALVLVMLFLFAGCSPEAATKTPPGGVPQKATTAPERAAAAPSKSSQLSSLEALQKGTLGEGKDSGPLRDVNFDFDRYDLRPDAREILKGHAAWLKANPGVRVEIEGHCDERGTNEYNLALGARRAETVKRYLVDLGISADRLSTISYGEELPLCKEQSEACWAKNRRARFVVKTAPAA